MAVVSNKSRRHLSAGTRLESLRNGLGITQGECVVRSGYNVRDWRRLASGEIRPPRAKLVERILIECLECRDTVTINEVLRFYDYRELDKAETGKYGLL